MATLYRDMAKLVGICYEQLQENHVVLDYLKKRKISKKTINKFFIGAFPSDMRVLLKAFKHNNAFLVKTGILYNADHSPFRCRPLIIPVMDANDNFIGIVGRTIMPEEQQKSLGISKYKNSIYNKGEHLFGLNYAKQAIREKNTSIVVEGQFDVITSHQAGLSNVVAVSGTALSNRQVMLLSRYGENIKMLFDKDPAGQRASKKFLEQRAIAGVNLKEMFLPDGFKDIDEYIVNAKPNINII